MPGGSYAVRPGQLGTVGVVDARVLHIAGEDRTLCGRHPRYQLWVSSMATGRRGQRGRLPLCKRCAAVQEQQVGGPTVGDGGTR